MHNKDQPTPNGVGYFMFFIFFYPMKVTHELRSFVLAYFCSKWKSQHA